MPLITVTGLVTRYANYRDNDRILTILTAEHGLLSAAARGCRREKSPLLSCSELFVYGEFVLFENRDKHTVDSCDVRERFYPLREDVDRFSSAMSMLELTNACGEEGQGVGELLPLLYYALTFTAFSDAEPLDMALCFAAKCMAASGYPPALTRCALCGADLRSLPRLGFDAEAGGAVCGACMREGRAAPVSALSLEALRRMLLLRPEEMRKVRLPLQVREELKTALHGYCCERLERRLKAFGQL